MNITVYFSAWLLACKPAHRLSLFRFDIIVSKFTEEQECLATETPKSATNTTSKRQEEVMVIHMNEENKLIMLDMFRLLDFEF